MADAAIEKLKALFADTNPNAAGGDAPSHAHVWINPGDIPVTPLSWPTESQHRDQIQQTKTSAKAQTSLTTPSTMPGQPVVAPRTTPQQVTNVRVVTKPIGTTQRQVTVQFTHPSGDPYFAGANVYLHPLGGQPVLVASGPKSPITFAVDTSNVPHAVHVTSYGNWGESSVSSAPSAPVSLSVRPGGGSAKESGVVGAIPPWSSTTHYIVGNEVVGSNGTIYECVTANTNQNPVTTTGFWAVVPKSLDDVPDGLTYLRPISIVAHRVTIGSLIGDTSGDTTTSIMNGSTKTILHAAMSTPVQNAIANNNVETGLDLVFDGTNYVRTPQNSGQSIVVPNGNFLQGTSGWTAAGTATLAASSSSPFTNGKSLEVTTSVQFAGATPVATFKASAGDQFFGSAYILSDGTFQAYLGINCYDGAGNFLAAINTPFNSTTSWVQESVSGAAPANTAYVQIFLVRGDASGGSHNAWFTDIQVTRSINPAVGELRSLGSTAVSLTNGFSYKASASGGSATVYWNGMFLLRSDGTVNKIGNGSQAITGLTAGQNYWVYPYYNEATASIEFADAPASPATLTGLEFGGGSGFVSTGVTTAGSTYVSNGFSFEGWFKSPTVQAGFLFFLGTGLSGTTLSGGMLCCEIVSATQIELFANGSSSITFNLTNQNILDGNFHHIAIGGTTTATYCVVDGTAYTGAGMSGFTSTGNVKWFFGIGNATLSGTRVIFPNNYYLSCLTVWTSCSDFVANIQACYNAMVACGDSFFASAIENAPTAPAYLWRLNDSGTTLADSIDSNPGTLNGSGNTNQVTSDVIFVYGSPAIAWSLPSIIAAQQQNLQGNTPLTTSSLEIQVPASGTGGNAQPGATAAISKGRFNSLLS